MDIFAQTKALNLPSDRYVVVGGGVLVALGLLDWDEDIDICVTPEIFQKFSEEGWEPADWRGKTILKHGVYDVGDSFGDWSLQDLQTDALIVKGVPFISLAKLKDWKRATGRPKDLRHLELIAAYERRMASAG